MIGWLRRLFAGSKDREAPEAEPAAGAGAGPVARETSAPPPPPAPSPAERGDPAPGAPPEPSAGGRGEAPGGEEAASEASPPGVPDGPAIEDDPDSPLRPQVIEALKKVYDPEIPVDVWELGLVYGIRIDREGNVEVDMTLTSPHCPAAEQIPLDAEARIRRIEGVKDVKVRIVWDPPWDKDKMSEAAKLALGID